MDAIYFFCFLFTICTLKTLTLAVSVSFDQSEGVISLSNGIISLNISEGGSLNSLSFGEVENILSSDGAYHDWNVGATEDSDTIHEVFVADSWTVYSQTSSEVTIMFQKNFNPSSNNGNSIPADVEVYFLLAEGAYSFVSWITLRHGAEMPAGTLFELRFVLKLDPKIFTYAAISDTRQRHMPEGTDILPEASEDTQITEARLITNPLNSSFLFEVEDKYHYMAAAKDRGLYGWISNASNPTGVWLISPFRSEYTPGGLLNQDLTVQTGAFLDNYFMSAHVGNPVIHFETGVAKNRTFGPWVLYLNSPQTAMDVNGSVSLWEDAKNKRLHFMSAWPSPLISSVINPLDCPPLANRGVVTGQLQIVDPYLDLSTVDMSSGWIGLASANASGKWAMSAEGYQHWAPFSNDGIFRIQRVRPGWYYLHAFIPGIFGNYFLDRPVWVQAGGERSLGVLSFKPPRNGKTLWEIGIPDRDSKEFFVPKMNLRNELYPYSYDSEDRFRNYGSWLKYYLAMEAKDSNDLVYEVGKSDWRKDWWYIQPTMLVGSDYVNTTRSIVFFIPENPANSQQYTLRVSLAAITAANVQIRVNSQDVRAALFDSSLCGCANDSYDNAMIRASSYGINVVFSVVIPGSSLFYGKNVIYISQRKAGSSLINIMYDYVRLEAPPQETAQGKYVLGRGGSHTSLLPNKKRKGQGKFRFTLW